MPKKCHLRAHVASVSKGKERWVWLSSCQWSGSGNACSASCSASWRSSSPRVRPSMKRWGMPLRPTMAPTSAPAAWGAAARRQWQCCSGKCSVAHQPARHCAVAQAPTCQCRARHVVAALHHKGEPRHKLTLRQHAGACRICRQASKKPKVRASVAPAAHRVDCGKDRLFVALLARLLLKHGGEVVGRRQQEMDGALRAQVGREGGSAAWARQ